MTLKRHVPSPYEQLLHALGDSERSRILIDQYAHFLADAIRTHQECDSPWGIPDVIDPYMHILQTWAGINRCPQVASPDPQPSHDRRSTAEYLSQTQQPDGSWEFSTSAEADAYWGAEKLRKLRKKVPDAEHRLTVRTTTVTVQPVTEPRES